MVGYELRRALTSREFMVSFVAAMGLAALQVFFVPLQYCAGEAWSQWRSGTNGMPPTVWASWMGGTPQSIWSTLFYYLMPLLSCAPFASSGCADINGGLAPILASSSDTRAYARAKLLASCVSGALVYVVPQVLNLLTTMLLVPLVAPDPVTMLFPITCRAAGAELYYDAPHCYTLLFLALGTMFACALNCLCVICSYRLRSRLAILLAPFLASLLLNFLLSSLGLACYSPQNILSPYQQYPGMSLGVVLTALLLALSLIAGFVTVKARKVDIL